MSSVCLAFWIQVCSRSDSRCQSLFWEVDRRLFRHNQFPSCSLRDFRVWVETATPHLQLGGLAPADGPVHRSFIRGPQLMSKQNVRNSFCISHKRWKNYQETRNHKKRRRKALYTDWNWDLRSNCLAYKVCFILYRSIEEPILACLIL